MQKLKCTIAYDGSGFSGFQIQPNQRTVQGEVEHALKKMHKGENIRIHSSGRTDAGVHAMAQVFHFETPLSIEPAAWRNALQTLVPDDIDIRSIEVVPKAFHARFDAVAKEYRYFVLNTPERDLFQRHYAYFSNAAYAVEQMQQACSVFEGTHDFTSFSSAKSTVKGSKVRTMYQVECFRDEPYICFILRGTGFLQHMVRIMVGALLEVGRGEKTVTDIERILQEKNRIEAGVTIPPEGLYLWEVTYPE